MFGPVSYTHLDVYKRQVARRVPGITVSAQGGLGVVGKPRVLINLNGRAIRSFSEDVYKRQMYGLFGIV